jgi:hypothetical protein
VAYYGNLMVSKGAIEAVDGNSLFGKGNISPFSWDSFRMKVVASSAAIIFGIAVLVMSVLAISNPAVVHPNTESATLVTISEATSASLFKMEYYLPYPGILPDSPLYKIKALRDRIALWLTFNQTDKSKKELLYADKRINAAIFLMQGGKTGLGVSTATKAEKYLESAAGVALSEAKKGKDVKSLLSELDKSANKHLEVLRDLGEQTSGDDKKAIQTAIVTTQGTAERVTQALRDK